MGTIFILLATHNGAKFLPELLDSILAQSIVDWRLLIRDDASSDSTLDVVTRFAQVDRRLTLVRDDAGRRGAAMNFGALMQRARELDAGYVLLADQDDVWLPDKLEKSLRLLHQAEARTSVATPLLVHGDLSVVDDGLRVIHPSMTAYAGVDRYPVDPLRTLLVYNFVTGCTAAFNRPLLDAALPLPAAAVMHDWWLALCAAALGQIWHLSEPVALYRQHAGNAIGVRSYRTMFWPCTSYWRQRWRQAGDELASSVQQARALAQRLETQASQRGARSQRLVADYCRLFAADAGLLRRYAGLARLGIGAGDLARRLSLAARVWRFPSSALAAPSSAAALGKIAG